MRIAYVCADAGVPVFGNKGSSVHVMEMLGALLKLGAEIDLFAMRFDGPPPPELIDNVRIHALTPAPKGVAAREAACIAANDELARLMRAAGPFDLVYERYSLWSDAALDVAHGMHAPYVLEVNAPLIEEQSAHRELINAAEARTVLDKLCAGADALMCVSEEVAAYIRGVAGPARTGAVHVSPNGVNIERFRAAPPGGQDRQFTVGFVGTLKPWHGLPVLIDAFERVHRADPAARLLIIGDGPERAAIEADVIHRGLLWSVRFTGVVAPALVPALLAEVDVATAPYDLSTAFYFSPLKVYEYMAAGLPAVVSRIGQLDGLIDDGVTGVLCAPGDADALARALLALRADPASRARIGAAARAVVERDHSWERVARRVLDAAGVRGITPLQRNAPN